MGQSWSFLGQEEGMELLPKILHAEEMSQDWGYQREPSSKYDRVVTF